MECPVCMDVFSVPLMLPGCGHTLCKPCADLLITPDNFLRCPECRMIYQLRKGVESLPKNIALMRTIEESQAAEAVPQLHCSDHPNDTASLYCHTCSKHICLKCYFSSAGTLPRRGETGAGGGLHQGHQVKTKEDVHSKETKLLNAATTKMQKKIVSEKEYIITLQETQDQLKKLLDEKLALIEKSKNSLLANIKQTASKLKFTLKGSIVRDSDLMENALRTAQSRLATMEQLQADSQHVLQQASTLPLQTLMQTRHKLEELPDSDDRPKVETFLKVLNFSTDVEECLNDPKRALSYQTERPRQPCIEEDGCIISDTAAYITLTYNQTVLVTTLKLSYKQAMFKGMSEKDWESVESKELSNGVCHVCLKGLEPATMYQVRATAKNLHGDSEPSKEVWFRTADKNPTEIRTM